MALAVPSFAATSDEAVVTWTGWFSDKSCAATRVGRGNIAPNNPDCVKKCLDR